MRLATMNESMKSWNVTVSVSVDYLRMHSRMSQETCVNESADDRLVSPSDFSLFHIDKVDSLDSGCDILITVACVLDTV